MWKRWYCPKWRVTARALYKWEKSQKADKKVRRLCDLKMEREGASVTCDGKMFHRRAAATGNALPPSEGRRVRRTSGVVDEAGLGLSVSTLRRFCPLRSTIWYGIFLNCEVTHTYSILKLQFADVGNQPRFRHKRELYWILSVLSQNVTDLETFVTWRTKGYLEILSYVMKNMVT